MPNLHAKNEDLIWSGSIFLARHLDGRLDKLMKKSLIGVDRRESRQTLSTGEPVTMSYITTFHDLIKDLERDSSVISSMVLGSKLSDFSLEHDLSAFANQVKEKALVQTALEQLVTRHLLDISDAEDITRRLLQETSFYGAFSSSGHMGGCYVTDYGFNLKSLLIHPTF